MPRTLPFPSRFARDGRPATRERFIAAGHRRRGNQRRPGGGAAASGVTQRRHQAEADVRLRLAGMVSALLTTCAGIVGAAPLAAARPAAPPSAAASGPAGAPPEAAGHFSRISVPGAIQTMPEAITDTGLIVGCYQPQTGPVLGFIDRHGKISTVSDPAAGPRSSTLACLLGANGRGVMVGYYQAASGQLRGFVDRRGRFTPVSDPAAGRHRGEGTQAAGINDAGVVTGSYRRGNRDYGFVLRHGKYTTVTDPSASRPPGGGTALNGISDNGTLSGGYLTGGSDAHGFVERAGQFTTLRVPGPGRSAAADAEAAGISPRSGLVVGSYRKTATSRPVGFSFRRGVYRTLKDPAATAGTEPQSGNDAGRIVGIYRTGAGTQHGFVFTPRG
jgi:hypothetical protein